MNKKDRNGGNKTQRLYRFCSDFTLSMWTLMWTMDNVDNELGDL